ncbi:MAG: hypothetical protein ACT4OP_07435 [Actinomycetota bacterium]
MERKSSVTDVTTPNNQKDRFQEALKLGFGIAKQLSTELNAFGDPRKAPRHMQAVGETYLRTISFYRAVLVLAEKRVFLSEATALARPLLEDALRLAVMADMDEPERIDAIATWNIDGINNGTGVMVHSAESLGVGDEESRREFAKTFESERAAWEKYRATHGSGKTNKGLIKNNAPT